jgi:predicted RNA binding protein with dsRBD fold (UPF0201 family)
VAELLSVECEATAELNPSEDPEKVEAALRSIVDPDVQVYVSRKPDRVTIHFSGEKALKKLKEQAAARKVRSVLRRLVVSSPTPNVATLLLNRQALTRGLTVFVEDEAESPLGPVILNLRCKDKLALADFLAPFPPRR